MTIGVVAVVATVAIVGIFVGWIANTFFGKKSLASLKKQAQDILQNAEAESETLKKERILEANEESYTLKQKLEDEFRSRRVSLQKKEQELNERDNNIDRKADFISKREAEIDHLENDLKTQENNLELKQERLSKLITEQNQMLEKIAGLNSEEAKKILMDNLIDEAKESAEKTITNIEEEAKKEALKRAQNIVISAIQQSGINMAIESTVASVNLPSDDMKGRIIGREGRNIRAFEVTTGVDVIVDDTPGSIILSGFDPLRREIGRIVMEKLVTDGRIHPGRIEDMYEKVQKEMDEFLQETGEQALLDSGVHGVHPELAYLLGKLRFRISFGQNVLQHSKEVSVISGIMAAELGLDVNMARRAGILHDIGRAVERTSDNNHAQNGFDAAKKYNENPTVLNAIAAHHGDIEPTSPIAVLVQTANEISISRPGARREAIENFVQRLNDMENIAKSFDGVEQSYAIQAGKEIRVVVSHEKVEDKKLNQLAQDIAAKIEKDLEYPGQIKVVVIREFRGIEYA
jgi:ribonuclease Y